MDKPIRVRVEVEHDNGLVHTYTSDDVRYCTATTFYRRGEARRDEDDGVWVEHYSMVEMELGPGAGRVVHEAAPSA
jgi:hypothetical protein